jgi:putative ABC transport system ATP-binding protein
LLEYLQIGHRKHAMPSQLSSGEAQRVAIAVTHDEKIFDRFDRIFRLRDGLLVNELGVAAA